MIMEGNEGDRKMKDKKKDEDDNQDPMGYAQQGKVSNNLLHSLF